MHRNNKIQTKIRISAHKSNIKVIDNNNPQQKTKLPTHCTKSNHTPGFNNVKIVDRESNYSKRLTLEMLHILNTPANLRLNFKTDTISKKVFDFHRTDYFKLNQLLSTINWKSVFQVIIR